MKLEETYGWRETKNGYEVKLIRAGRINPLIDRGGVWFSIIKYEEYKSPYTRGFYYGVGGKEEYVTETILRIPYFVDITNAKTEGEYPLIMYKFVFGKEPPKKGLYSSKAEERYAKLEKECSESLKRRGYDSVVFYYEVGVHKIADQVFLLKGTECYKMAMRNLRLFSR